MQKAVRIYNERFHSTIKSVPKEVQNRIIHPKKILNNLKEAREKLLLSRN